MVDTESPERDDTCVFRIHPSIHTLINDEVII